MDCMGHPHPPGDRRRMATMQRKVLPRPILLSAVRSKVARHHDVVALNLKQSEPSEFSELEDAVITSARPHSFTVFESISGEVSRV